MSIEVKCFDELGAEAKLKECHKLVRDYVKKLKENSKNWQNLCGKAVNNMRERSKNNGVLHDVSGSFSAMDMQEFAVYVLASWNSGEKKKTDEYLDEWVANDR
jgi:hypothetical protein